jgi:N-acetylated-alpha-linked acidic dipeptidase
MSFTGPYGVYHSLYDNHTWMTKYGDPKFLYHTAMTRLWGVMALRLANADIVPLDYRAYADRVREFVKETIARARPADRAAFAPLEASSDRFMRAARAMATRVDALLNARTADAAALATQATTSRALMQAERALLDRDGIPGRPWYRHLIYAPKPTYAPEVLPGVAEAIDAGDRARLADQIARLAAALDRAAATLNAPTR